MLNYKQQGGDGMANERPEENIVVPRLGEIPARYFAGGANCTTGELREMLNAHALATRIIHKPTATVHDAEVAPGFGPTPVVLDTVVLGLKFDLVTDVAYRILKIPNNFEGSPTFHVHWTKSSDADESGKTIRWRIRYTVFDGIDDEVSGSPTEAVLDDTYEDSGTTTRVVYRTADVEATGFQANYYCGIALDYVAAQTTLASPVVVSADLLMSAYINMPA